jgi:hypothetical protein
VDVNINDDIADAEGSRTMPHTAADDSAKSDDCREYFNGTDTNKAEDDEFT